MSASHPFLRSSGLTLSGHETPKTSPILLNMGRTRPRYPLLAGKSRFYGISCAGFLLVVYLSTLIRARFVLAGLLLPSTQGGCHRSLMPSVSDAPSTSRIGASSAVFHFFELF